MSKKGIAVAGNMIVDMLYPTYGIPKPGELVTVSGDVDRSTGGCLCNDIVDLAKLDPTMPLVAVGRTGDDEAGKYIMEKLRDNPPAEVLGRKLVCVNDYLKSESRTTDGCVSEIKLPKSNVLKFIFEDGLGIIARPSGTEPKLKIYYTVKADTMQAADDILAKLAGKTGVFAAEVLA